MPHPPVLNVFTAEEAITAQVCRIKQRASVCGSKCCARTCNKATCVAQQFNVPALQTRKRPSPLPIDGVIIQDNTEPRRRFIEVRNDTISGVPWFVELVNSNTVQQQQQQQQQQQTKKQRQRQRRLGCGHARPKNTAGPDNSKCGSILPYIKNKCETVYAPPGSTIVKIDISDRSEPTFVYFVHSNRKYGPFPCTNFVITDGCSGENSGTRVIPVSDFSRFPARISCANFETDEDA